MTGRSWTDRERSAEERVELLLAELTVVEKAGQLNLVPDLDPVRHAAEITSGQVGAAIYSPGANVRTRSGFPDLPTVTAACQQLAGDQSRLGVPLLFVSDVTHGLRTTSPIPLGLAATWDLALVERCARTAAVEAAEHGLHLTLAPMADLCTEARWGRIGETFGAEPSLAGRMVAASVRGFQADGRLAATAKHFVGYGLVDAERDLETPSVGRVALQNQHLRPFRAALAAGARAIMLGLHDVDGVAMHANRDLVRRLLKTEWGFGGAVVSDWDGIGQLVQLGVATDRRHAARLALEAGVDLDLASQVYVEHLPDLAAHGELGAGLLDDAVRRVLRLKLDLGLLDPAPRARRAGRRTDDAAARDAAAASMVLLKNDGILPLHANVGLVHLSGPFVDDVEALRGSWVFPLTDATAASPTTPWSSPAQALRDQLGADLVVSDGRFSDVVLGQAAAADLTVAVVGQHPASSGEDRCLPSADLPVGQLEVLRELAALGKPLVVVVVAANPPALRPVLALAGAVVLAWHPGTEGGPALADLLLGRRSPTGRLPVDLPRSDPRGSTGGVEPASGRRFGRSRDARFGRYLDTVGNPDLSLGHGLGYTTFAYSPVELSRDRLPLRGGTVRASVDVVNTGARPGREVVQLYVHDLVAEVTRPPVELADWRLVDLDPGQSSRVVFGVRPETFGYWTADGQFRVEPGDVELTVGPNAARGTSARLTIVA